ncbi:MAG: hypothetical protein Tsb0019_30780 [Roseibium sp.]
MSRSAKVFAASYFLACSLVVVFASLVPSGDGPVAVFARPWGSTALEIIARADGRIVHVGDRSWIAVTEPTDREFVSRLYQSGAGFVASTAVARACAALTGASLEKEI